MSYRRPVPYPWLCLQFASPQVVLEFCCKGFIIPSLVQWFCEHVRAIESGKYRVREIET